MKRRSIPRRQNTAPASPSRRLLVVFGAQLAVMGALGWRMRKLQIEEGQHYLTLAEENRINVRLLPPARGEIFDRFGRPIAVNRQNYRVVLVREQAGDVEAALDDLGRLIPIDEREREAALREIGKKSAFVPVTVAEHLDWESFARVNANAPALPGVAPEVGLTRDYPEGEAFAHVIGHVGPVNERELAAPGGDDPLLQTPDFQIGKNGVEKIEEARLRGRAGAMRIEVNAAGRVIREIDRREGVPGADLSLTLDRDLQRYAMERMAGQSAATVALDIATGDVLCLASSPGFDPNQFVVGIGHEPWNALLNDEYRPLSNKTVSGQYPPGSTFKMVVAMAALEAGVVGPEETFFCNGGLNLGKHRFHCWRRGGHGFVDCRTALEQSCDVYYYETARSVGVERIAAMAHRLRAGRKLDVPLTAVRDGLVPTRGWKRATRDEGGIGDTLQRRPSARASCWPRRCSSR
jgi:penicillin-binding protein 2